jgi:hypothetical protein
MGGQGRGRTADLPLFRIKDHCPAVAPLVCRPARDLVEIGREPRYTNMYETRNETTKPAENSRVSGVPVLAANSSWVAVSAGDAYACGQPRVLSAHAK